MFHTEERVALHRGAVGLDDAAQGIGEEHIRIGVGGLTNEHAAQDVIIGVALVDARPTVEVLFEVKGVDGHRGAARAGRDLQNAAAASMWMGCSST